MGTGETSSRLMAVMRSQGGLAPYIRAAMGFSVIANLTLLVAPLYMLQVYDRVLASGSIETLILISAVAALLMCVFAIAELGRRRAAALAARAIGERYDNSMFEDALGSPKPQALRADQADLATLQTFASHGTILPLFDLPFTPFFIALMFLIHPILGWLGFLGALLLLGIATYAEIATRQKTQQAQGAEQLSSNYIGVLDRQRAAVVGMGMISATFEHWKKRKEAASEKTLKSATDNGVFAATTRGLRMTLQIAALGVGAALVLAQQTTPGAIIAGSIILGRALAPIDQSVGIWRQIIRVRTAWAQFGRKLFAEREADQITSMPRPDARLELDNLEIGVPGAQKSLMPKFSLNVGSGEIVSVVGAIGAGKTTFLQTISGISPAMRGTVRLGGIDMHRWEADDRGKNIGYLPQGGELVPGSVTQNIARFQGASSEEIFSAARKVAAHETISALPQAYDTPVGPDGMHVSTGQAAKIALARAWFRDPVLVLLDEPSANLDRASRGALLQMLAAVRRSETIVIMATHDPALIQASDKVIILSPNRIAAVAPADYLKHEASSQVLQKVAR